MLSEKREDRCNAALSMNWVDPGYLNITGPSCSKGKLVDTTAAPVLYIVGQ